MEIGLYCVYKVLEKKVLRENFSFFLLGEYVVGIFLVSYLFFYYLFLGYIEWELSFKCILGFLKGF